MLAEKLREAGQPTKAVVDTNITVADYAVRWLSLLENNVKPRRSGATRRTFASIFCRGSEG